MGGREISTGQVIKVAVGTSLGTTIEWYDFFLYGYAASLIFPKLFFPPSYNPLTALLVSLSTYAVGFVARPVGAMIFGHLGDKLGRRTGLLWDLILMGIGTGIIGFLPGYSQIGFLALTIATISRILQGIGVGGEWGGATTWLTEYAAKSRWRAFWGSWVQQGVPIGLLWASAILGLFATFPSSSPLALLNYGWRIAFWIGAIAAVIGIVIRLALLESPLFERVIEKGEVSKIPSIEVWRKYWSKILLLAASWAAQNAGFYLYSVYSVTFLSGIGFPKSLGLLSVTVSALIGIFITVLFGILSDKIGRRLGMMIAFGFGLAFSFPYVLLLFSKSFSIILLAQILMVVAVLGSYAIIPAFFAENFPTKYRYSGTGLSYHMAAPFAGGLAPIIVADLVGEKYLVNWWAFGAVFAAYFIISLIALAVLKETKGKEMD
ncbi:MFS transporter [Saccharolobus shibatae]|uniref:Putative MFS-type transporter n=1 Tax=Saccharolobus shibatae TaxID=2286 RepID=A0A8F5GVA9_9CREN|nr:MFS transporter [Saccharolobus shibatae]QXJ30810.1 putative MFS-type transporter [Saccharolobus shibatae]